MQGIPSRCAGALAPAEQRARFPRYRVPQVARPSRCIKQHSGEGRSAKSLVSLHVQSFSLSPDVADTLIGDRSVDNGVRYQPWHERLQSPAFREAALFSRDSRL